MDLRDTAFASLAVRARRARPFVGRRLHGACTALFMTTATAVAAPAPAGAPPTDPVGQWRVEKGLAIIRVVNCDGQYWGVVAWEQNPGIDDKNPDATARNRPTLGMPILLGMKQSGANEWSGQIYNSQDGRTYSAKISLADPDTLKVQGCVFGFLCGGENWSRVNVESTTGLAPGSSARAAAGPPKSPQSRPATRNPSQAAAPRAPQSRAAAPQPDQPATPQTQSDEDICLSLVGAAGSTHQRGLK